VYFSCYDSKGLREAGTDRGYDKQRSGRKSVKAHEALLSGFELSYRRKAVESFENPQQVLRKIKGTGNRT
jgi:hypothetical protein